jgi:alkanesulfonate monooxygenase SsuD/methylene tetrahydromethanopterin reductase-like flavin-dependent oxidoreductase (luciferase family)
MRTGLMLGTAGDPGTAAEARRAEQLGFDLVAAGEHVFFHGPTANAFVTLAAAAAVTERVRLLSALTILPLYPMAMAAKLAATLDLVSRGRFDLGVGVGGEFPPEFAASGVPVGGRGTRAARISARSPAGTCCTVTRTRSWPGSRSSTPRPRRR